MPQMHSSLLEALDKAGIEHTTIELTDEYLLSKGIDPIEHWARCESNHKAVVEFCQTLRDANKRAGNSKIRYG